MKYLFLALILGSLSSCGMQQQQGSVDPEFQPFVNSFIQDAESYNVTGLDTYTLNVHFVSDFGAQVNPLGETEGECLIGQNVVTIRRGYFDSSTETQRQILLYHELGHCLLGLQHDQNVVPVYLGTSIVMYEPESIMYPILLDGFIFIDNEPAYLKQLFQRVNPISLVY